MFEVKECIGFLTNHGAKLISEAMNQYFKSESVTRVQWTALYYIEHNPGIIQKQLAEKMMVKEPTLLHLIDRMEKEGLVVRTFDNENRRMRYLNLTNEGRKVFQVLLPVAEQFNLDATRGISEEDLNTFKLVINKMIENIASKEEV